MNQNPEQLVRNETDRQLHACVNNVPLYLPSILEQQIVQEIKCRLSVFEKIEETITASPKQAEALR